MVMTEQDFIVIDGSYGEGGGQIVRTSLSLAMITGQPLKLVNIRRGRKKPGLRPQHLTSVQACGSVCNAHISGAELGGRELSFTPKGIRAGNYKFSIGTAGAATLVLQAILPPLAKAKGESALVVTGGTHVPWSPPFHYLAEVFLPTIDRLGTKSEASLFSWGWYPRGGGAIQVNVQPQSPVKPDPLDQPFELKRIAGISASSRLPEHIRIRQKRQLEARLQGVGLQAEIELLDVPALNPGSFVFVGIQGTGSVAGFSALGARGKPAERVADEAADALFHFLDSRAALDHHLADQILIYLATIPGEHRFVTSSITKHLLTNAWVIEQFMPVQFEIAGGLGEPGTVVKRDR
jgi:RNA 3'-terminal phosphate cyclase (ATP)